MIRIYKSDEGSFIQELRRGAEKAEIYSLAFDVNSKFLACCSDRGTVHIFSLSSVNKKLKENFKEDESAVKEEEEIAEAKNQKSM